VPQSPMECLAGSIALADTPLHNPQPADVRGHLTKAGPNRHWNCQWSHTHRLRAVPTTVWPDCSLPWRCCSWRLPVVHAAPQRRLRPLALPVFPPNQESP
jgi:hypothetical protein